MVKLQRPVILKLQDLQVIHYQDHQKLQSHNKLEQIDYQVDKFKLD